MTSVIIFYLGIHLFTYRIFWFGVCVMLIDAVSFYVSF